MLRRRNLWRLVAGAAVAVCAVIPGSAAGSGEVGANDFRISGMGVEGGPGEAAGARVAYNSAANEYLVVWVGDDTTSGSTNYEVYGQRIDAATGAEVGVDDFPISSMPGSVDAPDVVYNSIDDEYLVVWFADSRQPPMVAQEFEIFGQRLDAQGVQIGSDDFRISDMGPDGTTQFLATAPAATYNSTGNEYLVVWAGDDGTSGADLRREIFGQRLSAGGTEIGADFMVSDMDPPGIPGQSTEYPEVAYNSQNDMYLAVWQAYVSTPPLVVDEYEIYGQLLTATGARFGFPDFRISDMGGDGDDDYDAFGAHATYNPAANEFLVTWYGDDNTPPLVDEEYETYGQRLSAMTGLATGTNDFRITNHGPAGDASYDAFGGPAAYDSVHDEYLVAYSGTLPPAGFPERDAEAFGERVNATTGAPVTGGFRLSDMGPDGNPAFVGGPSDVAYDPADDQHLVTIVGNETVRSTGGGHNEIYGQRYTAATPTAVSLLSHSARRRRGAVELRWTTASDLHVTAFDVFRRGCGAGWSKRTAATPARTGVRGGTHLYRDRSAKKGCAYTYRVRARDGRETAWTFTVRVAA